MVQTYTSDNIVVNIAGFQLIWWLCVLLGNRATVPAIVLICLHIAFNKNAYRESLVIVVCACTGFLVDTLLTLQGFFVFKPATVIPPLWLFVLWLGFAATLRHSLRYFHGRYYMAGLMGALAGTLSYLAAARLGAVDLVMPFFFNVVVLIAIWSALFPLLMLLSSRIGGHYET